MIQAVVELNPCNPRFGCPRIARIISQTFGIDADENVVYRVLKNHHRPAPSGNGRSWLSFIGHAADSLWSVHLAVDANLRILEIDEIKNRRPRAAVAPVRRAPDRNYAPRVSRPGTVLE